MGREGRVGGGIRDERARRMSEEGKKEREKKRKGGDGKGRNEEEEGKGGKKEGRRGRRTLTSRTKNKRRSSCKGERST